ncbi:hypothetical protein AgCh_035683 [Apium graveolens]
MEAANQTKVDVAEARMKGEIRVKAEVKVFENERETEVAEANAELVKRKAGWAKDAHVAEVEAEKEMALQEAELQKEVEIMNALTQTKKLKAEFLSKASVEYETKQVFAEGVDAYIVVLMEARASRAENQDAIDTASLNMLADLKEAHTGVQELRFLSFNPISRQ